MDAVLQFLGEGLVHHPVLVHAGQPAKGFGHDFDTEVAFTHGMRAGMPCMLMALVNHAKGDRMESRFQLFFQGFSDGAKLIHNKSSVSG